MRRAKRRIFCGKVWSWDGKKHLLSALFTINMWSEKHLRLTRTRTLLRRTQPPLLSCCPCALLRAALPAAVRPPFPARSYDRRDPKRRSALTALSSLACASMPASSSLSSSGFPPPKNPTEFLRGRNGIRGSAERQAGACQRDAQCRAVFMPAKTVCALVKQR